MKATVTVEQMMLVTVAGVDLGRFELKDTWEGLQKLVNAEGEVLIALARKPAGGLSDAITKIFADIASFSVGREEDAELEIVAASPSIHARLPKQASQTTPAGAGEELSNAARDVLAERRRQVEVEGWTPEHDDEHDDGDIASAASAYALASADALNGLSQGDDGYRTTPPGMWPWARRWWKPGDPRRMLIKACALGLAEIERLDRKESRHG